MSWIFIAPKPRNRWWQRLIDGWRMHRFSRSTRWEPLGMIERPAAPVDEVPS